MKKLIIISLFLFSVFSINAQNDKAAVLEGLEKNKPSDQEITLTATTKSATRLFGEKDDLTTVILIIPSESVVTVIGSDSTYLHVKYEDNEGYIFRRHATLNEISIESKPEAKPKDIPEEEAAPQPQSNRFTYLENKYGTSMAAKMMAGKIWKGMTSEMVRDAWGKPQKINRIISGNTVKEEWIYKNTWLYLQNDVLAEWGPIK